MENDPQVQELTEWFDAQWLRAYELDKVLLKRIAAFMKLLPKEQVVEDTPNSVISPPLSTQLTLSLFRGRRLFPVKGCFSFLPPVEFTQFPVRDFLHIKGFFTALGKDQVFIGEGFMD